MSERTFRSTVGTVKLSVSGPDDDGDIAFRIEDEDEFGRVLYAYLDGTDSEDLARMVLSNLGIERAEGRLADPDPTIAELTAGPLLALPEPAVMISLDVVKDLVEAAARGAASGQPVEEVTEHVLSKDCPCNPEVIEVPAKAYEPATGDRVIVAGNEVFHFLDAGTFGTVVSYDNGSSLAVVRGYSSYLGAVVEQYVNVEDLTLWHR